MYVRGMTISLLYLMLFVHTNWSQQLQMTYYTVNEGLPSNTIRKIFQDSHGNIWISSLEGLSRYNGHHFINYSSLNGLPHTLINDMLEMPDGTLLFACNDGNIMKMQHDRIIANSNAGVIINQFLKLKNGKILVATDLQGIQEFKEDRLVRPKQPFPNSIYLTLDEINDSLILAGSDSSVQILTQDLNLVKRIGEPSKYYGENYVLKDSRGVLWASHMPNLQVSVDKNSRPGFPNIPELSTGNIHQVFEDRSGNIWFATRYGLVKLNPEGKLSNIGKKNGLLSDVVICVFEDREENLWVGTSLGLCKIPAFIIASYEQSSGLMQPPVYFIKRQEPGQLMISAHKGWQIFNINEGSFSGLVNPGVIPYALDHFETFLPPILTNEWNPVNRNSKAGKDIEQFLKKRQSSKYQITQSGDQIFISIGSALYLYKDGHFIPDTAVWPGNKWITGLVADKNNTLWVGTWEQGLFRYTYDPGNQGLHFTKKELILPSVGIRSLLLDKSGKLWVGTRYRGVFRLEKKSNGELDPINWNTETGLASNWIYAMYEGPDGSIWLLFQDGLDKMVKTKTGYRPFNFSRANNYSLHAQHMLFDKDGIMWLATSGGIVQIKDRQLENSEPWPVTITSVSAGDSSYHPQIVPASFSNRRNSLQIDFSAITHINEKQVQYSYRLMGSGDTSWSKPQNIHSISFASLRHGDYRFEVRSLGWNGHWSNPAAVSFTILPPLLQKPWFLIVSGLLLAVLIAWIVRRRFREVRHEAEMKQQLAETEMMALRAQMNPHFLFNSLNAIDSLIQTKQHDKATTYLGRFARLLRLVLDSSKNKQVPFDQDIAAMQLYLEMEQFRYGGQFKFEIKTESELINGGYSIPPLLAQPFIENAIIHGLMNKRTDDRRLTVKATLEDDFIVFKIMDNGIGQERAGEINALNRPEHISYGKQITTQRLALHNGGRGEDYVKVEDIPGAHGSEGTQVTLKIKINPS